MKYIIRSINNVYTESTCPQREQFTTVAGLKRYSDANTVESPSENFFFATLYISTPARISHTIAGSFTSAYCAPSEKPNSFSIAPTI